MITQQDAINQIVEAKQNNKLTINLLESIDDQLGEDEDSFLYEPHGFYTLESQLIIYGHETIVHIDMATKKLLHVEQTR